MNLLDKTGLTYFWGKLKAYFATKTELNAKQDTLVSGSSIKTINGQSILGGGNINIEGGGGSGVDTVTTLEDGTFVITLSSGDTITVDINHEHPQYPKYVLLADEAAYESLTTKDSDTLYLIPESE